MIEEMLRKLFYESGSNESINKLSKKESIMEYVQKEPVGSNEQIWPTQNIPAKNSSASNDQLWPTQKHS